jgi:hypothetical protein
MSNDLNQQITILRTCVAFLGEKEQRNWWRSSFLSRSGEAFIAPIFPKTNLLARINGASAAAQLVHDEHIGIGDVFHLFRLPENFEQDINQLLKGDTSFGDYFSSEEVAFTKIKILAGSEQLHGVGPSLLNQGQMDQIVVKQMAAVYLSGFNKGQAVYPYFRGTH